MTKKKDDGLGHIDQAESWLNRTWRPAAAVVYLIICLFDLLGLLLILNLQIRAHTT